MTLPRLTIPRLIKIIAITQVWGAATGTWDVVRQLAQWGPGTRFAVPLVLGGLLCFYTLLGFSALSVLRNRQAAVFWLAATQLPQFIVVQTPAFLYRVLAGVYVVLHAGGGEWGVEVGITSSAAIRWGDLGSSTVIGINVLAVATLWYLAVVYPSLAAEERRFALRAPDQVGESGADKPP